LEEDGTYWQDSGSEPLDRIEHVGGGNYDLLLADGGRVKFEHPAGSTSTYDLLPTQIVDPFGQTTVLTHDSAGRLVRITEPGGRYLQITYDTYSYQLSWNGRTDTKRVDVISKVEAFAGPNQLTETVNYVYQPETVEAHTYYNLKQVNYDDGTQAHYTYFGSDWNTMVSGRIHTCNDVRYAGAMSRIEYQYETGLGTVVGQIKGEKYPGGSTLVSQVIYPAWNCYPANALACFERTERRADGAQRFFQYSNAGDAELKSYTDFKNQPTELYRAAAPVPANYLKVVKDARRNTTSTEKTMNRGAVMAVTRGSGQPARYTYSDPNNPYHTASRTDENGYTTYHYRDAANRIWQTNYPGGSFEQFTYNGFGQVLTHRMTSGGTATNTYDSRGLKRASWPPATPSDPDPWNHPTRYNYYQSGPHTDRLLNVIDPRGNATWYEYNLRGQVTKVTHQDGAYTQNGYNPDGTLAWTADENHPLAHLEGNQNQRTRYEYDEYKRVTKVTNPLNEETIHSYEPWNGKGALSHTTSSIYWSKSPMQKLTHFDYDPNFRRITLRQAPGTADDAWTWFSYDKVGNLETTTDPRGKITTFGYDDRNRQTTIRNALNETTTIEYDDAGNKRKETRPDSSFRRWEYNQMNRLRHTYGFMNEHTEYLPDAAGNVTKVTDAKGAVYDFGFDDLNRKISGTYPPDQYDVRRMETWRYDRAGNLALYKNPAGQYKHFDYPDSYDSRNRLRHAGWNVSATSTAADWNVGQETTTDYDPASRMTQVRTNNGETVVSYGYDDANRKVWEDQTLAGHPTRRVETPRDPDGNRSALQVPGYYSIGYGYTQRNQLADIFNFCHFTYDPSGNMTGREGRWLYTNVANFEYDDLNRVKMGEQGTNGWVFARSHYQYDSNSREKATWRDEQSSKGEWFDYNPNNQLTKVHYNADQVWTGSPQNREREVDYTYTPDTLNRQSVNDNGAVSDYGASGMNQYTSITGQGLHYDNNFNLWFLNGGYVYYDADKRVTSVWLNGSELLRCTYDGLGRVVRRTESGTTTLFTYDEWNQIMEWDEWGNFKAWNIYGARADEILARNDAVYGGLIYKQDKLGNVVALLDGGGEIKEKYTYDVFGQPKVTDRWGNDHGGASWYGNRFMFTGREYLAWIASYDYRNRFYRPSLGRFFQVDPIGLHLEGAKLSAAAKAFYPSGQAPDSFASTELNLFRYCADDPVNKSDPFGLYVDTLLDAGFIAYDLYKIITDSGNRAENWNALGLDVGAAAVPFATGAGAVYRAGNAAHRANQMADVARATNWAQSNTLARHFRDHGADFGARNAQDYAKKASDFFKQSQVDKLPTKIDSSGTIRVYDPKTNTFGSYNPDGTTKTFFKPDSPTYFHRQPGDVPWN